MKKPTAWVLTAEDDVSIQAVFYRIHFKMEDNMELLNLSEELKNNAYPGRGIVIGKTPDGKQAVTAYFIMGRSSNSRNRVFVEEGEGIRTQAFDPSKLEDPSLIIYAPVRVLGNKTIVTNGDQTDTIYEGMDKQLTFEQSLRSREFEPDGSELHSPYFRYPAYRKRRLQLCNVHFKERRRRSVLLPALHLCLRKSESGRGQIYPHLYA